MNSPIDRYFENVNPPSEFARIEQIAQAFPHGNSPYPRAPVEGTGTNPGWNINVPAQYTTAGYPIQMARARPGAGLGTRTTFNIIYPNIVWNFIPIDLSTDAGFTAKRYIMRNPTGTSGGTYTI